MRPVLRALWVLGLVGFVGLVGAMVVAALYYDTPLLASIRGILLVAVPTAALGILGWARFGSRWRWFRVGVAVISVVATFAVVGKAFKFRGAVRAVLAAPGQTLARVGSHVVVGYRDPVAVQALVERQAIAGIYVTQRNIQDKGVEQLAREIAALQALRERQGVPPLIVATDHEGGPVAHLAPPLSRTPPLREVVEHAGTAWANEVDVYAQEHARELKRVGVNLNFAPVVDLRVLGAVLATRALADDPRQVTQIATVYCRGLQKHNVGCTFKHFPGLGSVAQDTHWRAGQVTQPRTELAQRDWLPFAGAERAGATVMVGHTMISEVDPHTPSSVSQPVLEGVLRDELGFGGIVMTDDLSMLPIALREGGAGLAAVEALNHGADLVLIAYDTDLVYDVLHRLIRAQLTGELDDRKLASSRARLADRDFAI